MNITAYTVEKINDSFGILTGDRYELLLELENDAEDELFEDGDVQLKVLYKIEDGEEQLVKYDLIKTSDGSVLDFELEDDEIETVRAFCSKHCQEALENES